MVESIKKLREICQQPLPELPFLIKIYVRILKFLSIYITKILLYTPITANQLNFIMFVMALVGIFLLSTANYFYVILGILILHFEAFLDAVDGEIARYRKQQSPLGAFIDSLMHGPIESLAFLALTINVYKTNPSLLIIILGFLAAIFIVLAGVITKIKHEVVFIEILKFLKQSKQYNTVDNITNNTILKSSFFLKKIYKELNPIVKYYVFLFILLFGAIFNKLYYVLLFYGIILPLNWIILSIYEIKIGLKPYKYLYTNKDN